MNIEEDFYMKKLNNKGFTLIELLAVIVILAVVMGIAANSVIISMNKARAGSVTDSAMVIADGFSQELLEAQVEGKTEVQGMNFASTSAYVLPDTVIAKYRLKAGDYDFAETSSSISLTANTNQTNSFVYYDADNGKFIVCLVAHNGGSLYVDANKKSKFSLVTLAGGKSIQSGTTANMVGCSNGAKTW